jgi:hypothetical protein
MKLRCGDMIHTELRRQKSDRKSKRRADRVVPENYQLAITRKVIENAEIAPSRVDS